MATREADSADEATPQHTVRPRAKIPGKGDCHSFVQISSWLAVRYLDLCLSEVPPPPLGSRPVPAFPEVLVQKYESNQFFNFPSFTLIAPDSFGFSDLELGLRSSTSPFVVMRSCSPGGLFQWLNLQKKASRQELAGVSWDPSKTLSLEEIAKHNTPDDCWVRSAAVYFSGVKCRSLDDPSWSGVQRHTISALPSWRCG